MTRHRLIFSLSVLCSLGALASVAAETSPSDISTEYFSTLRSGDTARLRDALQHGAPANARDAQGNTPLILTAAYGNAQAMQLLLESGAEVNATNLAGATALMRAAADPAKVGLLLAKGANANARSALGNTPLLLAARPARSHEAVAMLLAHGADARATNNWGATPLMAAVAGGDFDAIKLLVKHGADVNAHPGFDHASFFFAGARSALMWAAFRGDCRAIQFLIEAGAQVNAPGLLGSPLSQAAWGDHVDATRLLIERGAKVNQPDPGIGYTPLHWASSTEQGSPELVKLLLSHGADPNLGGGENVDAFMGTAQTPLMLARRRGDTPVVAALVQAGATNATPDRLRAKPARKSELPDRLEPATILGAINQAIPRLQKTSLESKQAFLQHGSRQDCISCHQQMLPMTAIGLARKHGATVDKKAEAELITMVGAGEIKNPEADWQALFHPDAVHTKGYTLLALAAEDVPPSELSDASVHHLATIQGRDGQWFNNLPRPPIQTGDIPATALAIQGLRHYSLPGRESELTAQVARARDWLWSVRPVNAENRAYQILGLGWSGEPFEKLQPLARALVAEQREDGGWAQLTGLQSDAYATGQAVYALRTAAGLRLADPAVQRGLRFLLTTQLDDGTWFVRRRAFPFQPTMDSGFPHGRDSWISAAASSWAVMALSTAVEAEALALKR